MRVGDEAPGRHIEGLRDIKCLSLLGIAVPDLGVHELRLAIDVDDQLVLVQPWDHVIAVKARRQALLGRVRVVTVWELLREQRHQLRLVMHSAVLLVVPYPVHLFLGVRLVAVRPSPSWWRGRRRPVVHRARIVGHDLRARVLVLLPTAWVWVQGDVPCRWRRRGAVGERRTVAGDAVLWEGAMRESR